jgi:D-alanine-D-alanine ligase
MLADRPDNAPGARCVNMNLVGRRTGRIEQLQTQAGSLLQTMRIAVVYGGDKNEDGAVIYQSHNPRSWKSYENVARDIAKSLQRNGARNVRLFPDDMRLASKLLEHEIDFVWLNSGGVQGYTSVSHAASTLEMLGVPYLGHDPLTGAILDSKHAFKRQMIGAGIPTARFMTWHCAKGRFNPDENEQFQDIFGAHPGPFVVKPVSGRASLNVEYVETADDLGDVVQKVFDATQNFVMIERYLPGREFCIAACGTVIARKGKLVNLNQPFIFSAVERVLRTDEHIFTSMDTRPITEERVRSLDPSQDGDVIAELAALARAVVAELAIETLVRLDVRADADGKLFVLETNPKPDLKAPSKDGGTNLIAAGLAAEGMSYDDLILSLFADRIDVLMSRWRGTTNHILSQLETTAEQAPMMQSKRTGNGHG